MPKIMLLLGKAPFRMPSWLRQVQEEMKIVTRKDGKTSAVMTVDNSSFNKLSGNICFIPKFCREIEHKFRRYGLKQSSAGVYTRGIKRFCCRYAINPYDFPTIGLERIEELMTDFIADNRDTLAPKYLNIIFNAVKRWCYITKMIKSAKMFKEIKFDKSSRKSSALRERNIATEKVKIAFKITELDDSVDFGLYSLVGLRPQIIPQLKVNDIITEPTPNYEIDKNGKFRFTVKSPMMIIPRNYKGNKGNIDFIVFIPTKLAELIEMRLNRNGVVTKQTKISEADNVREIYYKMKKVLQDPAIGFNGRPYLLRSYADNIIMRIERIHNDRDFKEFLMGHKGTISAIYQMRGMTKEEETQYRKMYVSACDKWVSEQIFEMISKEELDKAELLARFARQLGANETNITQVTKAFKNGKIDMQQFETKLTELTNNALNTKMEQHFEQMFLKMQNKHNNQKAEISA